MATNAVSSNDSSNPYAALNGTQKSTTSTTSDAQDRFLTLLTTQLKNQDPLNPMDNAQMTSQLAQISTVDGITKLNTTLQKFIDGQTQSQALQAATLVGRGVLVPATSLTLNNSSAVAGYELTGAADSVKVDIKDTNGQVVRTLNFGGQAAGVQAFSWDGKTTAGAQAADGKYSIAVSATQGGKDVTANALGYGQVDGVTSASSGLTVDVGSFGSFGISDIKQIL